MSKELNKTVTKSGITYNSLHWWIRRNYGSADKCEHPECKKDSPYYQWALKDGKEYNSNIDNFWQLCRKCHFSYDLKPFQKKKFDEGRALANKSRVGMKHTEEAKKKISNSLKGRKVWNEGKSWSEEAKKKMSDSHKGKIPWNKGMKFV